MGLVLPGLITNLHAVVASDPGHRRTALGCLLDVYAASSGIAKHLGEPDLAALTAMHARAVAADWICRTFGVVSD
ncbi:MAG TPA: hypothetical protein VK887_16630 [Pseudonocardiaceae bacterium]|nr:hypothetical protein [Pseudonocardiaceae bacterium]